MLSKPATGILFTLDCTIALHARQNAIAEVAAMLCAQADRQAPGRMPHRRGAESEQRMPSNSRPSECTE
jgi:hypothetical protein